MAPESRVPILSHYSERRGSFPEDAVPWWTRSKVPLFSRKLPHGPRSRCTHLLSTAISFSMLVSFPFSAFFGMHLIATILPVAFSRAITTSENAPLQKTERETCQSRRFICARAILTQTTCHLWVDRGHSEADRPEYTNSILWILTENWQVPGYGQQPAVLAYARRSRAAKSTANTFKTSEKHPFRTAESVSSPAICLHTWESLLKTNTELREYLLKQSVSVAKIPQSVHLNKSGWAGSVIAFFTLRLSFFFFHTDLQRHPFSPRCYPQQGFCKDVKKAMDDLKLFRSRSLNDRQLIWSLWSTELCNLTWLTEGRRL